MEMMNFIKNRKKQNRHSLIVDDLDLENTDICHVSNVELIKKIYEQDSQNGYDSLYEYNEQRYSKEEKNICQQNQHICNICFNKENIKDTFMILTCGHIFHIKCLVTTHYSDVNKYGIIDEKYFNSQCCLVCNNKMEMEDILYVHNKFYKNTKEHLVKQDARIDIIDKQLTKLKEELRICYDYKQRLEQQREKSKQITVIINTLM